MAYCEDYPCCGHTDGLGCDWTYTAEARAFDQRHALCDHEVGVCDVWEDDEDDDLANCDHGDTSYRTEWRGEELWYVNRECDRCCTDLPDVQETDPDAMEFHRYA